MMNKIFSDKYLRISLRSSLFLFLLGLLTVGPATSNAFVTEEASVINESELTPLAINCSSTAEYAVPICCLSSPESGQAYGCAVRP